MDAAFTAEQDEIRRTLRELLLKRCGPGEVRSAVRTAHGYDEALWRQLAQDLGLPGLALAQEYGGVGCGTVELAVACEESGRALLPSPLLATAALAAPLITAVGTEAQRAALLPRIAAGELTATLAVPGGSLSTALGLTGDTTGGAWAGGGRAGGVQARPGPEGWRLYGEAGRVLDGHSAGLLLVAAHAGGFPRSRTLLFLVRADTATGLARARQTSLDETRPLARIELRDTAAELLGADDTVDVAGPAGALAAVGCTAAAVLAAEAVGAAASALDRTVEYVKAREQFGRAIGSFQAVKHRLADLYVRVQAARSAAYYAAWDPAAGGLALAQALETLRITTAEAVQLHGGIGFTWEHEAHLYFKRAAADELLFGPVHRLRDHAAEQAGLFTQDAQGQAHGQAQGPGYGPCMEVAV
ncbi:acyl-CoA dehydrogenase family protein [Streptomyces sp. AM2-3-1]|uniref:acyl-CoA dehydrogenase family protein n=1 Tax=Streptomyces sp. AM2-3-1 TaxID=3075824 RepID=UPI0028C4BED4|nr:acyl-CoA dehydrogenase family protein [Streptomyces sp. AM2-3-1]WNO66421.1 acyl-CoA dehydrogenase family protein [Streptomyces sp. AM2-3-1]